MSTGGTQGDEGAVQSQSAYMHLRELKPRITVVGVGGAGCNAVNNMIAAGLPGVEFVAANTDAQSLLASSAEHRIQLGARLTDGLGAGSRPDIGQAAAEEALADIEHMIAGSHMVFVAAGMGGGTGTGAAAVIARMARDLGALTVGIVTKPFQFEGARRTRLAEAGIAELKKYVDTLIVIPNQNLFRVANERTTFAEAFILADQVLYSGVACIVDLVLKEGLINLDFADVRTVMSGMGSAMMGTGEATGERRAILAAEEAISNPLLDDVCLKGARGLLLSITGGRDLTLYEVDEAATRVRQEVDPDANIIVGATFDDNLGDRVRVSIVASGMARPAETAATPTLPPQAVVPPPAPRAAPAPAPASNTVGRRLAEAMEVRESVAPRQPPTASPAGPLSPIPAQTGTASAVAQGAVRGTWIAPNDVTIEEGLPPLIADSLPRGGAQRRYAVADTVAETQPAFEPARPHSVRRAPPAVPPIEQFPAFAQHVVRANAGAAGNGPPAMAEPKRASLLERFAQLGRRTDANPAHEADIQAQSRAHDQLTKLADLPATSNRARR